MSKKKITIIGGDLRQIYMAQTLLQKGFEVGVFPGSSALPLKGEVVLSSLEKAMEFSDIVVCPIPFSKDKKTIFCQSGEQITISDFVSLLHERHKVFGGDIATYVKAACSSLGTEYCDFMETESVSILNAVSTAEGAIAEAIGASKLNLHKSGCMVLGYGRCAKVLCDKLKGMGARVTVAARSRGQLAMAAAMGMETQSIDRIDEMIGDMSYLFNTIPAQVLGSSSIDMLGEDAVIIDIASNPGGTDFEYCRRRGITALHTQGLPGKYAPKITAQILTNALIEELNFI